jgi:phage-related protein
MQTRNVPPLKPLRFVGSSLKDLKRFPADVQDEVGRALLDVQFGETPRSAKPLKGFAGASVLELVEDHVGDAYRAVYTVRFTDVVYVLHAFQKKSTRGIATPKHEMDVVRERLRAAAADYQQRGGTP